eukprot:10506864-Prorocentrum_lima.AAC.1
MTSSLVGSEMCIRDRVLGVFALATFRPRAPPPCRPLPCRRDSMERPLPVSYTHLTLPTICSV